jgi:PIN domain nuclease of toxin-antitoxin system
MKLLLDTHIWLWLNLEPEKLHNRVAAAIQDPKNELWLSSISLWEVMMFSAKKHLDLGSNPQSWVQEALALSPIREAAMNHAVALETGRFTLQNKDPVDRIIVATARSLGFTLVTNDGLLLKAKPCALLSNR